MPKSKQPSPQELYRQRKLKEERERAAFLPPGLINHGNTCFMNAVLQGLIATRPLHDLATFNATHITSEQRHHLIPSRSPQLTNGHGIAGEHEQPWVDSMPIGDQLLNVLSRAWHTQSERQRDVLSPRPLLNALGRKYEQYLDFAQQDAHEFLMILFDTIRMEEIDIIRKRQPQPDRKKTRGISSAKRKRPPSTSTSTSHPSPDPADSETNTDADTDTDTLRPLPDMLFAGQLTSVLVCQKCKRISQTYEDFYDISLSIKPEDYATYSPSAPASGGLFSIRRTMSGVKDKEEEPEDHHGHSRERRRDKLRKFAKRITTFQSPAIVIQPDGVSKLSQASLLYPRASSVPPGESIESKKADIDRDVGHGREALRRRRSRSLDHLDRVVALDVTDPGTGEVKDGCQIGDDEHEQVNGEENPNSTVESDWSVVREGDVVGEEEAGGEAKDEIVPVDGKKKKKEDDGWAKLGKRLSMGLVARPPKDKDKDKESRLRERIFEEIRARRKSRESSPNPGAAGRFAAQPNHHSLDPARPQRHHSHRHYRRPPPPPPLPPSILAQTLQSGQMQAPQSYALPIVSPTPKVAASSPLTQPPHQVDATHRLLQPAPPLESTASSSSLSYASRPSSKSAKSFTSPREDAPSSGVKPKIKLKPSKTYRPPSPTPAEAEYLRRVLADIDVSVSESSPTPSGGGWPSHGNGPSHALVNPFMMLMKGQKKGSEGGDVGSGSGPGSGLGSGEGDRGTERESKTPSSQSSWSSWLGMNRLSGIEECLRLFTSVEVLDNENMVGCRQCWKIANWGKGREKEGEDGEDDDDGEEDDDEDDEASSTDEEDEPLARQPESPSPSLVTTKQPIYAQHQPESYNTPNGISIPIISTTGPESPLEPLEPSSPYSFSSTPTRPRIPHPLRSNSADFISLSAISSREEPRILDASTLVRNASTPSIPSTLVSPSVTPYPSSPFSPYTLSNQLSQSQQPIPIVANGRDSLVIPRVPLVRRRRGMSITIPSGMITDGESDESVSASTSLSASPGSAVEDSGKSGADDGDDRLSIGSLSSSFSVSRSVSASGESSSAPTSAGSGKGEEVLRGSAGENGGTENAEGKKVKRSKKPKPVIMRPTYKRYLIGTAPPILIIHLKRFQQTNKSPLISFTPTYGFKKLEDYVTFPEYLDLTPFLAPKKEDFGLGEKEEHVKGRCRGYGKGRQSSEKQKLMQHGRCMYRLYAVVVHLGNMLGGHYIAYAAIPGSDSSTQPVTTPSSSGGTSAGVAGVVENESRSATSEPASSTGTNASITSVQVPMPPPPGMSTSVSNSSKPERQWAYISDTVVRLTTLEEVLKAKAYICMYERI